MYSGEGKLIEEDGSVYEGEFVNGLMEGNGHYKWSNGTSYIGEMKQGKL